MEPHDLARRLRETRKALGITQAELAAKLKLVRNTIVRVEKGDESLSKWTERTIEEWLIKAQPKDSPGADSSLTKEEPPTTVDDMPRLEPYITRPKRSPRPLGAPQKLMGFQVGPDDEVRLDTVAQHYGVSKTELFRALIRREADIIESERDADK
jgi:DNA-binding XRE family transcriptional regulator